ncbi:MAG: Hsp20/alpha crystallin family protein [Candidatus Vogelbacteria bacterium]|nr:Hsp20/alpha crystallin family protein [Candidatus Vogelbacteria bacterium]
MFKSNKKSFLDRFTGSSKFDDETKEIRSIKVGESFIPSDSDDDSGQLSVDVYQTPSEVIVQAMIAGVKPDTLDIEISREMITIRGSRQKYDEISEDDYFFQELYWGSFSRTVLLPVEVEADEAEAIEKNGLLTVRLPKINREKKKALKVKSI